MDYKNDDILREECEFGRRMGFLGKQAVHPRQLEIIQRCFLPTDQGKNDLMRLKIGGKHGNKD